MGVPRLTLLCLVDEGDSRFCQVVTCGAEGHCAGNLELSTIQGEKCLVALATFFVILAIFEDSDAGQLLTLCIRCELHFVANLVRLFALFTVAPDIELSVHLVGGVGLLDVFTLQEVDEVLVVLAGRLAVLGKLHNLLLSFVHVELTFNGECLGCLSHNALLRLIG